VFRFRGSQPETAIERSPVISPSVHPPGLLRVGAEPVQHDDLGSFGRYRGFVLPRAVGCSPESFVRPDVFPDDAISKLVARPRTPETADGRP